MTYRNPLACMGCYLCVDKNGKPCKRRYRCADCKRSVPWCFGAADDRPELCDDCWKKAEAA